MKFTIEKSKIANVISNSFSSINERNNVEILSNIKIDCIGKDLIISSTDLDLFKTIIIKDINILEEGSITAKARLLNDIIKKAPSDAVINFSIKDGNAIVKYGKSRFKVPTMESENYPLLSFEDELININVSCNDFFTIINKSKISISNDEVRDYLNGLFIHIKDGKLISVSTDGKRLSKSSIGTNSENFKGAIIPKKAVAEILKIINSESVSISISESKIKVESGNYLLVSKLINADFPSYEQILPNNNKKIEIDKKSFSEAIGRVSVITDMGNNYIKFTIEDNLFKLESKSNINGVANEEIIIDYNDDKVEVYFDAKLLLEAISTIESDILSLELSNDTKPMVIQDKNVYNLIMPIRL